MFVDLTSPSADLTIFCGDLNSTPNDLTFKLIKAIGQLEDTFYAKNTNVRILVSTSNTLLLSSPFALIFFLR